MSGKKIIDGLKAAVAGDFSRVTIEGQTWVRLATPPVSRESVIEECAKVADERAVKLRAKAKAQTIPSRQSYFAQAIEAKVIADRIRALAKEPDQSVTRPTTEKHGGIDGHHLQ